MKKERALAALKLVEYEYLEAEENIQIMQETVQEMGQNISASMSQSGGNANVLKALAEHGGIVLTMANRLDHETEELAKLRQR